LLLISALSFLVSEVIFTKDSERKTKCSTTNTSLEMKYYAPSTEILHHINFGR
jgi:hypothetical protein